MADSLYEEIRAAEQRIQALSPDEAKARALALLQDPNRFRAEPNTEPNAEVLTSLAPLQREVFSRYRTIEVATGESFLSIAEYAPSPAPGFFRIGGEEGGDYAIRPGDEAIYFIYATKPGAPPKVERPYPSIYHWVLLADLHFTVE